MFTPNTTQMLPVVLLLMAGFFAGPTASADPVAKETRTFQVKFAYNPAEPAAAIYADLKSTAKRACEASGKRSLHVRTQEQECTAELIEKAVQRLSRADVAAVHGRLAQG